MALNTINFRKVQKNIILKLYKLKKRVQEQEKRVMKHILQVPNYLNEVTYAPRTVFLSTSIFRYSQMILILYDLEVYKRKPGNHLTTTILQYLRLLVYYINRL